jgi:hypothetical protein
MLSFVWVILAALLWLFAAFVDERRFAVVGASIVLIGVIGLYIFHII